MTKNVFAAYNLIRMINMKSETMFIVQYKQTNVCLYICIYNVKSKQKVFLKISVNKDKHCLKFLRM